MGPLPCEVVSVIPSHREKRSKLYRQLVLAPEFKGMAESSVRKFVTDMCKLALGDYLWGRVDLIDTVVRMVERRRALVGTRSRVDERAENPGPPKDDTVEIVLRVTKPVTYSKLLGAIHALQVEVDKAP